LLFRVCANHHAMWKNQTVFKVLSSKNMTTLPSSP
jgi:hypothetical protein